MASFSNQNINQFYTTATKVDFARNNLFRVVQMGSPSQGGVQLTEADLVYLTTASIPGRTINNIVVPFMGMNYNVPGTATYTNSSNWNVTFRCNREFDIRQKLDQWSIATFDDNTSSGKYQLANCGSLKLSAFDTEGNPKYTLEFTGVYCTQVGEMAFDTTATGAVVTIQATLAYQYWRTA